MQPPRLNRIEPGTFAGVIRAYLASPHFAALAEATRYSYNQVLRLAERPEILGAYSVYDIRPSLVQGFLDGLASTPGKQKIARTALKAVESWAIVRDLLPREIIKGTTTVKSDGGHEPWALDHVALAERFARPDLARVVTMAFHTGQRGSDIIRMRWSDIEEQGGRHGINVVQKKTGVKLWVPMTASLSTALGSWERKPPFFLILAENGQPYLDRNLLSWTWGRERDTNPALLPIKQAGLVLHGLRATAVVRSRREGATDLEIASMYGMSVPMVSRYSRLVDQRQLALAAVYKLDRTARERADQNVGKAASQAIENK